MRLLTTTLTLLFAITSMAQRIVTVDAKATTDSKKAVFQTVNEALRHAERCWSADTLTEIRILPGVYWIDNPDDEAVMKPRHGAIPYGMEVEMSNVRMVGMGEKAEDVVLASQRGQTQGAIGNFTMLHIKGDNITSENLTFGNYCNVDLVYPRDTTLNRRRKADAIVQAQLIICDGDNYEARNCRFISRLNLCPFAGAKHALFRNCYFECTDDALCGTGVYLDCRFTLLSSKPFYSTSQQGAVLMNCDLHCKTSGKQYITKVPSPCFIIDCRFTSDDPNLQISWTPEPGNMLRCYASGNTLNGNPLTIGSTPTTVDITNKPLLSAFKHADGTYNYTTNLPSPLYLTNAHTTIEADVEQAEEHFTTVKTLDGREAVSHLTIRPSLLPAPAIIKPLKLKRTKSLITASYTLDLQGHKDTSDLLWYRIKGSDSILVQVDGREYHLTEADHGYTIGARLVPKTNRSCRERKRHICEYRQEKVLPGFWSFDTYKPKDTDEYEWEADTRSSGWTWGYGVDGAKDCEGYVQTSKGARMMYTSLQRNTMKADGSDLPMSITLECNPCKTAGQGFGSALGQYMDVCIKMNNETLSGYGLRIRRTPYMDKAVEMVLVKYDNGTVTPISLPVASRLFVKGCTVNVAYAYGKLTATMSNKRLNQSDITLSATVAPTGFNDFMLQHTGSVGASATVVRF